VIEVVVASGYATAIFNGDVLKRVNDGTAAVAAAGDAPFGIAIGGRYKDSTGTVRSGPYIPASLTYSGTATLSNQEATVVFVIPLGPTEIFEVDCSTATTAATAASYVGNNCDHGVGSGGSTASGVSSHILNTATGGNGGTTPGTGAATFRIEEISLYGGSDINDVTAANWRALVSLNESTEPPYTTTGV
jgi:hypothetical protein